MRPFDYRRPATLEEAIEAAVTIDGARYLAGGTNLVDLMKLGVETPEVVIDLRDVLDRSISQDHAGRLRIGAGARNSEVAAHPLIRACHPAVAQALLTGASGQLRNRATAGGNVVQRTRCPYFEDVSLACNKRLPGSGCSARVGFHRDHAILGASAECIATHPSDFAVALAAGDAEVEVAGAAGTRLIPLDRLYLRASAARETVLERGDVITAIILPPLVGAYRAAYRKARDRASFAFALASVAIVLQLRDGHATDVRIAFGGVAPLPWRARRAEALLRDRPVDGASASQALRAELEAARPFEQNAFKVDLVHNLAVATLLELAA